MAPRVRALLRVIALGSLVGLPFVVPTPAAATSCGPSVWEPANDLEADVIFTGDVVASRFRSDVQVPAIQQVAIDVEEVWKGDISGRVTVIVRPGGGHIFDHRIVAANEGVANLGLPDGSYTAVFDCGGRVDDELRAALGAAGLRPHPPESGQESPVPWIAAGVAAAGVVFGAVLLRWRTR